MADSTRTQLTLVFLVRPEQQEICLAMKKRGFGADKWNGYGGKCEAGESITQAACREVNEEIGVTLTETDLEPVGVFDFVFPEQAPLTVHAFLTRTWRGYPTETEEMRPVWFAYDDIPYDEMWVSDKHWLPHVLAGERLTGTVWFDATGEVIENMEWQTVAPSKSQ